MKITIDIDLTPEEARRAVGLPDLTPLHDRYVARLSEMVEGGIKPEMLDGMLKSWAPMGEAGLTFWRRMFEAGAKPGQ